MIVLACAALLCVSGVRFVLSDGGTSAAQQRQGKRLDVSLRSFVQGTSGRVSVLPNANGGRVRLAAFHLPGPQLIDPRARSYVVWAVAQGGRVVNLGTIEPDARGNGGLEFASPPSLVRYSIVVTAEANAKAISPVGVPVLSTKAGEIAALYDAGETNRNVASNGPAKASGGPNRRRAGSTDFYSEVDRALNDSETHTLILTGGELARGARGSARVGVRDGQAFVHARVNRLPPASAVGANTYVLWARAPDGRVAYLGSLPANINNMEIYVRAWLAFDRFNLFVTAETGRPAAYPSGRNVLVTSAEGTRRHRFWRRKRRRAILSG